MTLKEQRLIMRCLPSHTIVIVIIRNVFYYFLINFLVIRYAMNITKNLPLFSWQVLVSIFLIVIVMGYAII